ncbi:monooxygenase [Flagelloscypha sp. PMI_526]|nr:monooxygenase [Flagelloscypha sp. PMI_526]
MALPVLVVGAGVTGLVSAIVLTQNDVPVRVITKAARRELYHRGSAIVARTVEAHRFLGTYHRFQEAARLFPESVLYSLPGGKDVVKHFHLRDREEPTAAIPDAKLGVQVEYGCELAGLENLEDKVTATLATEKGTSTEVFDYLVGADGAHGVVRKYLSLSFMGDIRGDSKWIFCDIHIKQGLDPDFCHFWGHMGQQMFALWPSKPSTQHWFAFLTGEWDRAIMTDRETFIGAFYDYTGRDDIVFGDIITNPSFYTPQIRVVDTFQAGRAFVVGDAGHVHSPTGGQGLNSGFLDAINLGWKLSLVYKGFSPASLLATYTEERLPVIKEMLVRTTQLLDQAQKPENDVSAAIKRRADTDQLGVNYRWSSIVLDEFQEKTKDTGSTVLSAYEIDHAQRGARAGERAPSACGLLDLHGNKIENVLLDLFNVRYHRILVFSHDNDQDFAAALKAIISKWNSATYADALKVTWIWPQGTVHVHGLEKILPNFQFVVDAEGSAYSIYGVTREDGPRIVIVRPDGVVGAVVRAATGIETYCNRVFNGIVKEE